MRFCKFLMYLMGVSFFVFAFSCLPFIILGNLSTQFMRPYIFNYCLPLGLAMALICLPIASRLILRSLALTLMAAALSQLVIGTCLFQYTDFNNAPLFDTAMVGDAWEAVHPSTLLEDGMMALVGMRFPCQ